MNSRYPLRKIPHYRWVAAVLVFAGSWAVESQVSAETAVVLRQGLNGYSGTEDTTLFQDYTANSAGGFPYLFAGKTRFNAARRSLLKFDLQNVVPSNATITSVTLQIYLEFDNSGNTLNNLHRATRAWNEGSNPLVDSQTVGQGAPAQTGDSTWSHESYSAVVWNAPGGEFAPGISAAAIAGEAGTFVRFSGVGLINDIQAFVDNPATNHGWALLGNESATQTAKRYYSSEADSSVSGLRPQLAIEYETMSSVANWTLY